MKKSELRESKEIFREVHFQIWGHSSPKEYQNWTNQAADPGAALDKTRIRVWASRVNQPGHTGQKLLLLQFYQNPKESGN